MSKIINSNGCRLGAILFLVIIFSNIYGGELSISWQPNIEGDLGGYKIYYGTVSQNYSNSIDVANHTLYTVTKLTEGTKYIFAITAYDTSNNESRFSEEVTAVVSYSDSIPPGKPSILGGYIQGSKINLQWQKNGSEQDIAGYKVYYGVSSKKYDQIINVGKVNTYTTPELILGQTYFFTVSAYDVANNESEHSDELSVVLRFSDVSPPESPSIANCQVNNLNITINWKKNKEQDLKGYKVYYGSSSRSYNNIFDVAMDTSYMTPDLAAGHTYYFAISAYDTANNESEISNEVYALMLDKISPAAPTIIDYYVKDKKINIKWQGNSEQDLAGYKVYYGLNSKNYMVTINVGKSTSYMTTELVVDQTYYFALSAYDTANNESNLSDEYNLVIFESMNDLDAPAPPIITNYSVQGLKVQINWRANTESDLAGYKFYYGTSSRNYNSIKDVGNSKSYVTPDLTDGDTYYFAISSYDTAHNESAFSAEIIIPISENDNTPPPIPVISNIMLDQQKVNIQWNPVTSSDLSGYKVYYGMSSRIYNVVEDVSSETSFTSTTLSEGVTYYFAVTSYDVSENESNFSGEESILIHNIDITLPTIYAVEIRDSITVELMFSEEVEQISAETISNYSIVPNVQIESVVLAENDRLVRITTTPHQSGISYTIFVNNVKDLAVHPNIILANSYSTYQFSPADNYPPKISEIHITDATHMNITFNEEIDRLSSELTKNYAINNDIKVFNALLSDDLRIVQLTTSTHKNGIEYILTVNNIKDRAPSSNIIALNSSVNYVYYEEDTTSPAIYSAEIRTATLVNVIFTEIVDKFSSELVENYKLNNGISIIHAELDPNLQIIHLTTTEHQSGLTYILTVNNIIDRAFPPNAISPNSKYSYTYSPDDKEQPALIFIDIKDATHIDVTFSEDIERVSSEDEKNYLINNGINIVEAELDSNQRVVHLTTSVHKSGVTYMLTVHGIKDRAPVSNIIADNSSLAYTYLIKDTTPPTVENIVVINDSMIEVIFSEIIDRNSAETVTNYIISNNIIVSSAEMYGDLKTVALITSKHTVAATYTLTVSNIKDRSYPANIISPNSVFEYVFNSAINGSDLIVGNITRTNYEVTKLAINEFYYIDRSYIITAIPKDLQDLVWIKTANEDRGNTSSEFISFDIKKESKIYIGYDNRAKSVPNWLKNNFTRTSKVINVSEYAEKLIIWEKDCTKKRITLGGNLAEGAEGAESMYVILIKENSTSQPPELDDTNDPNSLGSANVFLLYQNYPNPFNAGTEIRFQLPEDCYVTLSIYNIIGQEVRRLVSGFQEARNHIIRWDGRNKFGHLLPSGVYFSRLEVVKKTTINNKNIKDVIYNDVRKMILLK